MTLSQLLKEYIDSHYVYNSIDFSLSAKEQTSPSEKIHPLYILSQAIIDNFIQKGENRVAIILPDNDCDIVPMLIMKYFNNILFEKDYCGDILNDIEVGQHLRLGEAVVQFDGIVDGKIRLIYGRSQWEQYEGPLNGPLKEIFRMLEKTDAALSSSATWNSEKNKFLKNAGQSNQLINRLKSKRTLLNKTICVLTTKSDFKNSMSNLFVQRGNVDSVVSYGEIDLDSEEKFFSFNKGKLDCLPGISITSRIFELSTLLKDKSIKSQIFSIYSTADKFEELTDNPDVFAKVLRSNIPFIAFAPESAFEKYAVLAEYDFKFWHWKPSTMGSGALSVGDGKLNKHSIFGRITEKVNNAVHASFKVNTSQSNELKSSLRILRAISKGIDDTKVQLKKLVGMLYGLQRRLSSLIFINENMRESLLDELSKIRALWYLERIYYGDQRIVCMFDEIIDIFNEFVKVTDVPKQASVCDYLDKNLVENDRTMIIIPDNYSNTALVEKYLRSKFLGKNICVKSLSDFYGIQENGTEEINHLIVTWFEKDEYIRIKQSYCYDNLVYIIYDFENRWRERFCNRINECLPHQKVRETAAYIALSDAINELPFDMRCDDISEYDEIADYNIYQQIVRSTYSGSHLSQSDVGALECITVILSGEKVARFYPTHDVVDVTGLLHGTLDRPVKKDAKKLHKGDKILIRLSDKDIVRETADMLMQQEGEPELREKSGIWCKLLQACSEGKTIWAIHSALNNAGADCSFQQVMYWIAGETIMPNDKKVLMAIATVASKHPALKELSDRFRSMIDDVYMAGKLVQNYHTRAGFQISSELKNKAGAIRRIALNGATGGNIEGIGDVVIYTVEEVLEKEYVERSKLNVVEDLY